jgi:putative transposase
MATKAIHGRSGRAWAQVYYRHSQYLNNRLEQDHRGVEGRYGPMRGFKDPEWAGEFCRADNELRNFLRSRSRTNQQVSADSFISMMWWSRWGS